MKTDCLELKMIVYLKTKKPQRFVMVAALGLLNSFPDTLPG